MTKDGEGETLAFFLSGTESLKKDGEGGTSEFFLLGTESIKKDIRALEQ